MFSKASLSQLCLRLGLGIVFVWIGIDVFRHPDAWLGYMPDISLVGLNRAQLLQAGGLFDIAIGISLITGFFYRVAAVLGALHLASVLLFFGIDAVLIRDVGLIGGLLSLFFWKKKGYRRSWLRRLWKQKKTPSYEEY